MSKDEQRERRINPDSVSIDNANVGSNKAQKGSVNDIEQDSTASQDNNRNVTGYALKFNTPSKPYGTKDNPFTEVIAPNALDDVDLSNVFMLNDHDFKQVLASTKAGTLKLDVDDKGLHYEATIADTTTGNDVLANVQAGNTTDTSFGFVLSDGDDQFTQDDDGNVVRTINKVKSIFDVSICAVGAYDNSDDDNSAVSVNTRSYEEFLNSKKEEKEMAEKTIINPTETKEQTETRSYEDYIRAHGNVRDMTGLTTENAKVVIPNNLITPALELKNQKDSLANLVNRKQVSIAAGTYPVIKSTNAVLATKAERAEMDEVDSQMYTGVEYKIATRAGRIYLSNEVVEDTAVPILDEVKKQLGQLVVNTDNSNISSLLTTANNFQNETATSLDDVKKLKNTKLDPALDLTLITNQDGFNYLDTLKDSDGRYLLQTDVTAPTGKSLFGISIVEVNNTTLASEKGSFPIFIGDLSQCIFEAYKPVVTSQWQEFSAYSQGLSVAIRSDYKVIDHDSGIYIKVTDNAPVASGK